MLLRNLNDFLVSIHAQKRRALVIIDEAQNLSTSALEEIRLLSNLEATNSKLMQIILIGQPELKNTIARYDLRQLRQRISVHSHIDPLTRDETEDYVYHRLETAGNRNALVWGEGTFNVLFHYSQGIPRLINVFCDFILLAACVEGTTELNLEFVQEVIGDVAWDKHVSESSEDQQVLNAVSRQGLLDRLNSYEQRMVALEVLLTHKEEINRELLSQKELLKEMLEAQENGFRRMEVGLERTCHHLQMYLTGYVAKDTKKLQDSDDEARDDRSSKGLLTKLFS